MNNPTNIVRALAIKGITANLRAYIASIEMSVYARQDLIDELTMIESTIAYLVNGCMYPDEHICTYSVDSVRTLANIIEGDAE